MELQHSKNLFCFAGFSSAKASSEYKDEMKPEYSIDGKISKNAHKHLFHSKKEDYPWLEMTMPEGLIRGVYVYTRYDYGSRLENIEVRAGIASVPEGFKGRLTINTQVGFFTGPAESAKVYSIIFDKTVLAKYITLQRIREKATLEINEVMIIV